MSAMKRRGHKRAIPRGKISPRRAGVAIRRTAITRSGSMMSETRTDYYGYNDRSELVSGTKDTAATNLTEYAYQYDDIGNRLSSLDLGTNRTYAANALNQYTNIVEGAGGFLPQFDDDMRPRQRRRVARRSVATEPRSGRKRPRNQTLVRTATGDWTVPYNAENRPVSWTCGTTNIVMLFDRMGRRVEYVETVTDGSGESPVTTTNRHHRFVYEITAAQAGRAHWALQAERTERSDEVPREPRYLCVQRLNARSGNAIELSFAWDPTEPVATRPLVLQRQGGWNFFYTHDGNKNVSDIVSFQQARGVPAHYEYAPFGAVTAATTNTAFTAFNVAETNPYRFSSEYADDTLGLVYYNYRHYNPMDGRWLQRDPRHSKYRMSYANYSYINNIVLINIDVLGDYIRPVRGIPHGWKPPQPRQPGHSKPNPGNRRSKLPQSRPTVVPIEPTPSENQDVIEAIGNALDEIEDNISSDDNSTPVYETQHSGRLKHDVEALGRLACRNQYQDAMRNKRRNTRRGRRASSPEDKVCSLLPIDSYYENYKQQRACISACESKCCDISIRVTQSDEGELYEVIGVALKMNVDCDDLKKNSAYIHSAESGVWYYNIYTSDL